MNTLAREAEASTVDTPEDLKTLVASASPADKDSRSIAERVHAYPLSPNTKGFVTSLLLTLSLLFLGLSLSSQETNGLWPFAGILLAMGVDYALRNL